MHPAMIKAELEIAGLFQADIARALNISRVTVGQVIQGTQRSQRIEIAIAEAISKPLHVVWPSRYGKDGKVIAQRRRRPMNTGLALERLQAIVGAH